MTPTYSPLHSDRSYNNSPDTPQISQELDNCLTLQQQLIHPNTLTIHQLSSTMTSTNPPTPTPSSAYTPSLAQSSTSTKHLQALTELIALLNENFQITRNFVDKHVLMPTLHWTAYYNFTNPLFLPLTNTHDSIEKNKDMLYRLFTPVTPRHFTYVGYKKLLKTFTAPRANEFAIEYYDHNIIRPNQDQFLDEDRFANPQLTEKIFIKTSYVFTLNIFLIETMITLFQNH